MPPASTIPCCQLCFELASDNPNVAMLSTSAVHKFLDTYATPTPFQYAYLQQIREKNGLFLVCGHCESWLRRQCRSIASGGCKTSRKRLTAPNLENTALLTLDRLILSIMLPGSYAPPEMRITRRHVTTLRRNGGRNWLSTICPTLVVRAICDNDLRLDNRNVLKSVTSAAWKSGRRQTVLGNSIFAKNVRSSTPEP